MPTYREGQIVQLVDLKFFAVVDKVSRYSVNNQVKFEYDVDVILDRGNPIKFGKLEVAECELRPGYLSMSLPENNIQRLLISKLIGG